MQSSISKYPYIITSKQDFLYHKVCLECLHCGLIILSLMLSNNFLTIFLSSLEAEGSPTSQPVERSDQWLTEIIPLWPFLEPSVQYINVQSTKLTPKEISFSPSLLQCKMRNGGRHYRNMHYICVNEILPVIWRLLKCFCKDGFTRNQFYTFSHCHCMNNWPKVRTHFNPICLFLAFFPWRIFSLRTNWVSKSTE